MPAAWLHRLGLFFAARFGLRVSSYPATHLLPRPTYRLLTSADVPTGYLLRRVKGKVTFATSAAGLAILQDVKQLCDQPKHLGEGFSVNLWGRFALTYVGWQLVPGNREASDKIQLPWEPPQPATPPTAEEMQYVPAHQWSALSLSVAHIHGYWFDVVSYGRFEAVVCHAPNCWNYWHYEVRFRNPDGVWLRDVPKMDPPARPYSNRQLRLLYEGLQASFVEKAMIAPVNAAHAPAPLSPALYDTAV